MGAHDAVSAARGAAWLAKQVERALGEVDLTMPQYRLLFLLEGGGATATYAAGLLAVSPPSVTAIVDGLEARSLVTRAAVESDRRRVELAITPEGAAALARADKAIETKLGEVATFGDEGRSHDDAFGALGWWLGAIREELASRVTPPGS